jgi:hypothetical protein
MNKKNRDKRTRKRKAAVKKLGGNEEERSINRTKMRNSILQFGYMLKYVDFLY